jgi:hypothetical protein
MLFTSREAIAIVCESMFSNLPQFLPATFLLSLIALDESQTFVYSAVTFLALALFCYLLWLLPLDALFRRPIESSSECPKCGSKDFRPSRVASQLDRFRKRLGLLPFRCRGCTRRFVSRSSGEEHASLPSQVLG